MDETRHERIQEALREAAAEFMAREANRNTLLTVTRVLLSPDARRATIYISVLPEEAEASALGFTKRNIGEFKEFFKTRVRGALPPHIDFEIDYGEKNRRRIDELSN